MSYRYLPRTHNCFDLYFFIFNAPQMQWKILFFFFAFLFSSIQSQTMYTFGPIIVTASRLESSLVGDMREILLIDKKEISQLPSESVSELLRYIGEVDVRRRSPGGIQADFGLRGSSFEQVLILVDGVRINDPQTGHHNGDIPIVLSDIERIEILAGHGSSLYGSDGFGGVIHIITKPALRNETYMTLKGGTYGTFFGQFSQSFLLGPIRNRIGIEKQKSNGHRFDTDYDVTSASYRSTIRFGASEFDCSLGYGSKDFGANGFYANFPSKEKTVTYFGHTSMVWKPNAALKLRSQIFGKIHTDNYILDIQRPSYYRNAHRTTVWGGEVQANVRFSKTNELALGIEGVEEKLVSSNLGNRNRFRLGLFGEMVYPLSSRIFIDGGFRTDYQKEWGFEINPSFSCRYAIFSSLCWRASVGRIFRVPTFTELYYDSPANKGNPALKPEWGWSWEMGFVGNHHTRRAEITFFYRSEKDRIDWIAYAKGDPWQVTNIGKLRTFGISIGAEGAMGRRFRMRFHYTGIHQSTFERNPYYSKYVSSSVKNHFLLAGFVDWIKDATMSVVLNVIQRETYKSYTLCDVKFSYSWIGTTISLDITNVLNVVYEEIPGVPMSGRRMMLGWGFTL